MISKELKEKFMQTKSAEELDTLIYDYQMEYLFKRNSWDDDMITHYINLFKISKKDFEEEDIFFDDDHGDPPIDINSMIRK